MPKVHILEGHSHSRRVTACWRYLVGERVPTIGRALILRKERLDEVTCRECRRKYKLDAGEPGGVCEHGDHPAEDGKRFCSRECARCEHESDNEGGCDGICGKPGEP
jgi:hypothetical protein